MNLSEDYKYCSKLLDETLVFNTALIRRKIRYTERPDAAAASVLEGNILIIVDSPQAS